MKKIVILLVFITSLIYADRLTLMTEVFPPFQYKENNKLTGISTNIVQEIQKRIHDTNKIKVYPWTRGIKVLQNKNNTAIFSMLRTEDREDKYKWVGPLAKMELVFFKRKDSKIELTSLDDARKVSKIGVTKNVGNYDILNSKGFKNLDIIKSGVDEKNIKKLIKGRIDLWPSLKIAGLYNAKRLGYKGEIVPIENINLFEGDLYIAFNKNVDDKIVSKWQKALNLLIKDGTINKIKSEY